MLTEAENQSLTETGPGTPMGNLFRNYWLPACLSRELTTDGAPLRLKLLGEDFLAFRDSQGQVGLVEPRCSPPRRISIFRKKRAMRIALCLSRLEIRYLW